jgi:predicted metal-dependent peptidase
METVEVKRDVEERKLKKVKVSLMRNEKFALWSGILMVGKTSIDDNIPTACTNGRDEMYGRAFVRKMSEKMLAFVVLHEALHKAFRHLTVWRKLYEEDPALANQACDYVINLVITDLDPNEVWTEIPKIENKPFILLDKRFAGMHSKQVFDILKKEKKEGKGKGQGQGQGPGQPGNQPGQPGDGEGHGGFDQHDWEGAKELNAEEKKVLEKEIDRALRQGQIAHQKAIGKGGGNMPRELGDLLAPKVDWREVLKEFVTTMCAAKDASSWRRINRRFIGMDIYMPSLVGEKVKHVVVGCDTSGSIGVAEHVRNISETYAVFDQVKPDRVDVIYWDSRVAGHEVYGEGPNSLPLDSFLHTTKPVGGGGTDPTSMMKFMEEEKITPDCIIMFTDGEIGDWGNKWNAPILWIIVNEYRGASIVAPCGKTVHLTDD